MMWPWFCYFLNFYGPQISQLKLVFNHRVAVINTLLTIKSAVSCYLFHSHDQKFILILVFPLFERQCLSIMKTFLYKCVLGILRFLH